MLEAWDRKAELVEEMDSEYLEERGGQVRKECFQVSADTREIKSVEVKKCDPSCDPSMQQLHLDLAVRNRGSKTYREALKLRQE